MNFSNWQSILTEFAHAATFEPILSEVFGPDLNEPLARSLQQQWQQGDFSALPPVVLLSSADMPGAAGAYSRERQTIYLNQDWLSLASAEQQVAVLLEELGHHLDNVLNQEDTPGDEGKLFAARVLGVELSEAQVAELRAADDRWWIQVEGQWLAVELSGFTEIPQTWPGRTGGEHQNTYAFAALKDDGSVVTWGNEWSGGNSSAVTDQLSSGVTQIFSNGLAFAALKEDGSVVTWGYSLSGGDSSAVADQLSSRVAQIFSTYNAFAALKNDGSVVTWGSLNHGGDSSAVADQLSSGVTQIFSNGSAFAALKEDGSVVTWQGQDVVGNWAVASEVTQIFSTNHAFAALKSDGSVITWGSSNHGGDSSAVTDQISSGVIQIFSNGEAFAALKEDGSVVTWGDSGRGGNSSIATFVNDSWVYDSVASQLSSGVTQIFSTYEAFAALKDDGLVVTWGNEWSGGNSSAVADQLSSGVTQIFSTYNAFAALKNDGSVVTWGRSHSGGDSSAVEDQLSSGVAQIFSTLSSFAALKTDGSVVTWGWSIPNSSAVADQLSSGVTHIFTNESGFAALKEDGSVVTWGGHSGHSSLVADQLSSGVVTLASPFLKYDFTPAGGSGPGSPNPGDGALAPVSPPSAVSLNPAFLEVLAKDLVYKDWVNDSQRLEQILNQPKYNINGFEYRLDQSNGTPAIWGSDAANFYAIGLVADGAPPILVTRGSDDLADWLSNRDENGVGFDQFYNYRIAIDQWLNALDSPAYITGHSLGGALAQWFGSYYTSFRQKPLTGIVTFNSPGINGLVQKSGEDFGTSTFDRRLVGDVSHYIADGDIVSLLGNEFIEGNVKIFKRNFFGQESIPVSILSPHLDPIIADQLPEDNRSRPKGQLGQLSIQQLNSPSFSYLSHGNGAFLIQGLALTLVNAANSEGLLGAAIGSVGPTINLGILMSNRGGLNVALKLTPQREALTNLLVFSQDVSESLGSVVITLGNLGVAGLEAIQTAVIATGNLGISGLEALQDLVIATGNLGVSGLEATQRAVIALGNLGVAGLEAMQTAVIATGNLGVAGLEALQDLVTVTGNLGVAGLEALRDLVLPPMIAIGNGGAAALGAIQSWGVDAWEATSNMTADAWRNAQSWTASTWQSTAGFTANQWDVLTGTLNNAVDSTINFISSTVSNIFNTSVTVSLAQPSDTEISISYQSVDGTALGGQDYVAVSGTLIFAPGETEKKIPIQLLNVGSIDEAKTFEMQLSEPQNVNLVLGNSILVNIKPNQAPTLQNPISSQATFVNQNFFFAIPEDTFADDDLQAGDQLSYEVSLADGSSLPAWLTFDGLNGFLVGTPRPIDLDNLVLNVTATDQAKRSVSTEFRLDVSVFQDDIVGPAALTTATRFIGNSENNIFRGSSAADFFDLTAGGANIVKGTLEQLDGDKIIGFDPNDVLLFKDIQFASSQLNVSFDSGLTTLSVINPASDDGQIAGKVILEGSYGVDQFVVSSLDGFTKVTFRDDSSDSSDPSEPFTPIQTVGDLTLGSTQLGYAIQFGDGTLLPATNKGEAATPVDGWQALAVEQGVDGAGFTLYWRNEVTQQTATWSLNAQGALVSTALLTPAQALFAETNLNVDLTGDGQIGLAFTPIQAVDSLTLGSTQLGYAIQFGDGTLLPVTINGEVATPIDGWQALAVEQGVDGAGFTLYWRNGATQQTATWSLNAQGAFVSSALLTPAQALFAETNLNVDLTGDGQIGLAFTSLQTVGYLTLGSTQLGYAIQFGNGTLLPVTIYGEVATPVDGWQALAVEPGVDGADFTLYWRNEVTQQTATWSLNAQGAFTSSALLTPAQALFAETNLNVDLTGDGQIGLAFTPIQTVGDLTLGSTQLGYAIQSEDGTLLSVTNKGKVATPVDGWQALAVEPGVDGAGFTLYWRNEVTQQTATWSLNAQGAFTSSALLTPAQALFAEANLNVDLTGDGQIGLAFTPIQTVGDLTLGSTQLGYAIQFGDGTLLPVTNNGEVATPVDGWQALAVEPGVDGAGFTLYWRNEVTQQTATWSLNAQGAFTSSALLTPAQALFAEANLNVDLTGDGQIGLAFTPIQTVGDLTLGSTQLGYAIQSEDGTLLSVTHKGKVATPVDGWQALAVESGANESGFTLYWHNTTTQQQATWSLNAQGAFVSSALLTPAQALFAETNLNVDLTGDGQIGLAFTPIQTVGDLTLGSTQLGYAIQFGDGTLLPVTNNGEVATPVDGWQALAVDQAADGAGFTLYWHNTTTQQTATWSLNAQGAFVSSALLLPALARFAETNLNVDLTGDGQIGLAFAPIQTVGDLTLGSTLLGYAIQFGDGTLLPVNRSIEGMTPHLSPIVNSSDFPSAPVANNGEVATPVVGWQAVAVDQAADGSGFTLYWRNAAMQQFLASSLNAQGTLLSTKSLTPAEVLLAEASLRLDLVGDGKIGPFAFQKGTDGVDELIGQPFTVSFGFDGNDTLVSGSTSYSFDILIGGAGNDLYRIAANQTAVILDGGNSPNDVLELVGASAENVSFSTIDDGRHLVFDVLQGNSRAILLDWRDEVNRINTFRAGETSWSYQELVEQINAFGVQDFSWTQLGGPFDDTLAQLGLNSSPAVDTLIQTYLDINTVGTIA